MRLLPVACRLEETDYEVHDHADPHGHISDLGGCMVYGIGYQVFQTYLSVFEIPPGTVALSPVWHVFARLGLSVVPLIVYAFFVLRAAFLLGRIERPSTIAYTRKVLWLSGPGIIVSTWVLQALLYRTWPVTPAAWLFVACVLLKLPTPMPLLTMIALAQALVLAWLWNLFLSRYGKVKELYSDPNGPDWGAYWRERRSNRSDAGAD